MEFLTVAIAYLWLYLLFVAYAKMVNSLVTAAVTAVNNKT
jgi:hypothetical protein